jgi:hypothetical protein
MGTVLREPVARRTVRERLAPAGLTLGRREHGQAVRPTLPSIALGIAAARRGDGYSLAVRIQDKKELTGATLKEIHRRASGEVDVRYIGRPRPASLDGWHRTRCEPLRPGTSIGSRTQRTTGTLGCFVEPQDGGELHLLSNAHVLAGWGKGKSGDQILQPGWDDGGRNDPPVATLAGLVKLQRGRVNKADCATAVLTDGDPGEIPSFVLANADLDLPVIKQGRTTGRTEGRVLAFDVGPVKMDYPRPLGTLSFDELIEIDGLDDEKFAARGDSGALVHSGDKDAIGLLFAVIDVGGRNRRGISYLSPLANVLDPLGMRLVP